MNRAAFLALLALPFVSAQPLLAEIQPPKPAAAASAPDLAGSAQKLAPAQAAAVQSQLLTAPLQFEENRGQAPAQYDYLSHGRGCSLFMRSNETKVVLFDKSGASAASLKLISASAEKKGVGMEPLPGIVNYFRGSDPEKWIKEVPTNARVKYEGIYPGVDVVYYGNQQRLEYDFVIAPNADPNVIRWTVEGAQALNIDDKGALVLTIGGRELAIKKPVAYQMVNGGKKLVEANYDIVNNQVRFALKGYDTSKELVIDPVVQFVYSTYMGGTTADCLASVAADTAGNVYLAGWSLGTGAFPVGTSGTGTFPVTTGTHSPDGNKDALVVKLNSAGTVILAATYVGGDNADEATGIALDPAGNVYIAGNTLSSGTSFPIPNAAQSMPAGGMDGFVTKLTNSLGLPISNPAYYSTFVGGESDDMIKGMAVTNSGEVWAVGNTASQDFYGHTFSADSPTGEAGRFTITAKYGTATETTKPIGDFEPARECEVLKGALSSLGVLEGFSTDVSEVPRAIGTNAGQRSYSIVLSGSVVETGTSAAELGLTPMIALPTITPNSTNAVFPSSGIGFVLDTGGYLDTSSMASAPITGGTSYTLTRTRTKIFELTIGLHDGVTNGFALKLTSAGGIDTKPSRVIGGGGIDTINGVAVDLNGNIYLTGGVQDTTSFLINPFVAKMPAGAGYFLFTRYPVEGEGNAAATDLLGNSYFGGTALANNFPVLNAFQTYPDTLDVAAPEPKNSGYNGFVMKMDPSFTHTLFSTYLGGSKNDFVRAIAVDFRNYIYVAGETESADFPTLGAALAASGTDGMLVSGSNGLVTTGSDGVLQSGTAFSMQSPDHLHGNAFLSVFVPAGNALRYSTYFGGSQVDWGFGVAVTPARNPVAFVAGYTDSDDFPVTKGSSMDADYHAANLPECYTTGFVSAFRDQTVDLWLESIVADTDPPVPGQPMTYTVTVKNLSDVDAGSERVWQSLSDSLQFVSADGANISNFSGGALDTTTKTVVATLGPVLAGREVSYRITVKPTGPQVVSTTATVQAEHDEISTNNSYTLQQVARPVLSLSVAQPEASEDGTPGIFTISRVGDLSLALPIQYTIGGTATNGTDYKTNGTDNGALTGTILLPAGSASVNLVVNPLADTVSDPGESVAVTVKKGADYELGIILSGTVTIDDVAPNTVNLSVPDPTAAKSGDTATFTISRTGNLGLPLTVNFSLVGSATNGADYKIVQSGTLVKGNTGTVTIAANTTSANVVITPIPDSVSGQPVATTTVDLQVQAGSSYLRGATVLGTATITDFNPDVVRVTAPQPTASASGTSGSFRISRTGDADNDAANSLTVAYTMGGTAVNGTHYETLSGQALIPAGASYIDLPLNPVVLTGTVDRTAILKLSTPANAAAYTLATGATNATVNILQFNGAVVTVTTTRSAASLTGTSAAFEFTRTGGDLAQALTINYSTSGGAIVGTDYILKSAAVALSGSVTFPPNNSKTTVELQPKLNPSSSGTQTAVISVAPSAGYLVGSPFSASATVENSGSPVDPTVNITVVSGSATEAAGTLRFRVTRVGDKSKAISVNYAIGGSATNGVDYQELTTAVALGIDDESADIVINPIWDNIAEPREVATVQLTAGSGYSLGSSVMASGIIDNVSHTVVSLAVAPSAASESGSNAVFTLTRSGTLTQPLAVNYTIAGSAVNGVDYQTLSGSVAFAAGSATATIVVSPIWDSVSEPLETVTITLNAAPDYDLGTIFSRTATIADVAPLQPTVLNLAVTTGSASESSGTLVFRVTRSGTGGEALTIPYVIGGSATNGADYKTLTGSVAMAANATTADIVVEPVWDNVAELAETVSIQLSAGTGYTLGTKTFGTGIITNVPRNVVTLAVTKSVASESGTNAVFTVTRTGDLSQAVGVNYTVGGSAANGLDYQELTGSVAFPANSASQTIVVQPVLDNLAEVTETVTIQLSPGTAYDVGSSSFGTATIANSSTSGTPIVSLVVTESAASEAGTQAIFTVVRAGSTTGVLSIPYSILGTAANGVDYESLTGNIVLRAGESSGTIVVNPVSDGIAEPTESVIVTLQSGIGYTLGNATTGVASISNSETLRNPIVYILATDSAAAESGDTATFTVYRAGNTDGVVSIPYTLAGTATPGVDYSALTGNLVIPAGATSGKIIIFPTADSVVEPKESVIVTLGGGVGYTLGVNTAATAYIENSVDNVVSVSATDPAASESGDPGVFTLTRTGNTTAALPVYFAMSGSGSNGIDYTLLSGSATIPAGALSVAVRITPKIDNLTEGTESAILTLLARDAYALGTVKSATVTIADVPAPVVSLTVSGTNAITEGGTASFRIARTGATIQATTVAYTIAGSALSGVDYTPLTGSVTIPAGATSVLVSATTLVTPTRLTNSTLTLTLSTSSVYNLGTAKSGTVTIKNYSGPIISVAVSSATASETGVQGGIRFTRSLITGTSLAVRYSIAGTATSGTDYTRLSGTVIIPASVGSVIVPIVPVLDNLAEGNETVILTAAAGTGYLVGPAKSGTVTITDSVPALVSIAADSTATSDFEKNGQLRVVFSRTGSTAGALTVGYALAGTAVNGKDYTLLPGTISIPAGLTSTMLLINLIDNSKLEPNRTVVVSSLPGPGYTLVTGATQANLTILDDDLTSPSF